MISPSSQPKSFSAPTMIDSNGVVRRRIRTGHMSSSSNGAANANPASSSSHRRHIQQNRKPNSCSAEKSSSRLVSVTGITNLRCLACSDGNYVAHAAGSAIVVDPECQNEPPTFILNSSKRNITSLCCSADGRFLATGESGHNPKVRIFDLNSKSQIKELQGHRYSIDCVRISTSNPHIVVSVGNIHDTSINVWNWKTRTKLASNNICAEVYNLQFSEDNSYFVTVGVRHVKFWYLPMLVAAPSSSAQPRSQSAIRSITLKGRSAILGEHKQNVFRDVLCFSAPPHDPRVLVLTQSGLLIELDTEDRLVMRWVDVTTTQANCMVRTCDSCIVVGCANGLGRIFDSDLSFLANIPLPSTKFGVPLGTHPSITALAFDSAQRRLHAIYDDHSQVQWEDFGCHLPRKREKTSHCSMVWALDTLAVGDESENLITGSSDGTIRLWSLVDSGGNLKCLRTLVPDETPHEHPAAIRSICVCRSIGHVAIGDAAGNISVYQNAGHSGGGLAKIAILEAHENDVLSLAYSHRFQAKDRVILASSGRDRVIHLLDASSGHYEPLGSISDHSGSIQTVHLVNYPQHFNEYLLISSGADKAIVVRKCVFEPTPDDELKITRLYQLCERHSLTDLVIDRLTNQFLAAYQDRFVRIYSLNPSLNRTTCQLQFKGCTCSEGGLVKMRLLEPPNQPGQSVLATACSRKRVYLWKWNPSSSPPINLITIIAGAHSDPITDMRFVGSGQFLVTCSADSCLMVWQVPVFDRSTTQSATRQLNQSMKQSPKRRRWAQLDHPPVLATANESSMFDDHHDKQSTFLNVEKSPEDDRISSTTWTRADENVPPLSLQLKSYINDLLADYKSNPTQDATDALIWARNTLSSTIGFSDQTTEVSRSELVQKLCHLRSQNIDLYRNAETMINAILAPLLSMADNAKDMERSSDL